MSTEIKTQFPIFTTHPDLVYLDSGASGLKCAPAIDAMQKFYETNGTNIHRGLYDLSEAATEQYEAARQTLATFIGANSKEIIFTSGTTGSLNLAARLLEQKLKAGDEIVLSRFEHHANLIPWQQMAKRTGTILKFIDIDQDLHFDLNSAHAVIGPQTKIVAFTAASNVTGTLAPIHELVRLAKQVGAYTVIDAAQLAAHRAITAHDWGVDFMALSGHKMYGPTGIGVLYGKAELLDELEPVNFGGDMIREVTFDTATWADAPAKFEPGTPPIAEVLGLAAAADFISQIGWDTIFNHERELNDYALVKLNSLVKIIGPIGNKRLPVFSFVIPGTHPHDIADILNRSHIAIRAGHHCAQPLMTQLGLLSGTARASFGIYNTTQDIDALVEGIGEVKKIFQV